MVQVKGLDFDRERGHIKHHTKREGRGHEGCRSR